jgi:hypothetical protein
MSNYYGSKHKKNSITLNKFMNNKQFMLILSVILLLLLFIKFRAFIVFIIVIALAAVLNYFIHVMDIHIHLGHVSFLAVIFSYKLGFWFGVATVIIAHVFAEIFAGHLDKEMFITGSIYLINCFLASIISAPIVSLGIGLTVFQAIATITLGLMTGTSIIELITEDGVEFVMLIIYYLSFAVPLVKLIG